ncbi:MAG: hypothetical protein ACYCU5_14325 [Actinomycetes bacterium]
MKLTLPIGRGLMVSLRPMDTSSLRISSRYQEWADSGYDPKVLAVGLGLMIGGGTGERAVLTLEAIQEIESVLVGDGWQHLIGRLLSVGGTWTFDSKGAYRLRLDDGSSVVRKAPSDFDLYRAGKIIADLLHRNREVFPEFQHMLEGEGYGEVSPMDRANAEFAAKQAVAPLVPRKEAVPSQ